MSSGGFDILHAAHEKGVFISYKPFLIAFVAANVAFLTLDPMQTLRNYEFLMLSSPVWLPVTLGRFAFLRWVTANRLAFIARQQYVLLEVRVPRDVRKTPLAMEAVFSAMHLAPGESTWWKRIVNGAVRPSWSFEMVSLGGRVHLFIRTRTGFRRSVEAFMYAQYPDIEIVEATDYSLLIDPSHPPYNMWGCEYKFLRTGGLDVWPLRTYIEFMNPAGPVAKPEEQVDPLAQIFEFLGSLNPKEQFWIQILVRVTRNEKFAGKKNASGGKYSINDQKNEQVEAVRNATVRKTTRVDPATGKTYETESFPNPSKGQQWAMEALERKVSKPLFDVGIRVIYTAPQDAFVGTSIAHIINLWKPFASEQGNSLGVTRWFANFDDWPWEDPHGHHHAHVAHGITDAYRRRSYFNEPYKMPWMIMNSEELATLFHVPSGGVTTPSLPRIPSATSEAPTNLPI